LDVLRRMEPTGRASFGLPMAYVRRAGSGSFGEWSHARDLQRNEIQSAADTRGYFRTHGEWDSDDDPVYDGFEMDVGEYRVTAGFSADEISQVQNHVRILGGRIS